MHRLTLTLLVAVATWLTGSPAANAQTPTVLWWHQLAAPSFGSAATGDIDGDGRLEIVFGTYFNDEHIYALNAEDGSTLWSYDTGGCNDASPVIADVDQDGELEVVIPASSPCMVYCFNGATGAIEWSISTVSPNCIDSPPAVADVDNDGRPEVILGTFYGHVFCLNGENGSTVWMASLGSNSYIQTDPAILDCDGDGQLDVVVAQWAGDNRIYALRGNDGSTLWYSDLPEDYMYHGASFADLDEDGRPELAIGCYDGDLYVLNAEDGSLCWEYTGPLYIGAPTSIADLNNDGHLEIVFAPYNAIKVISHTGIVLWTYSTGGSIFRGAAIADVNNDQRLDVVFGSDDGSLRALRGDNGAVIWTINLEALYGRTFDIDHAPIIADFNGDDSLDVFVIGGYGTSSTPTNNHGRAYALTAGSGNGPGWPMFRLEPNHSAYFTPPVMPVTIELDPDPPPIVIPPAGGSFMYSIRLTNSGAEIATFDAWVKTQLPNGSWYGPVLGPLVITLPGNTIITRLRTQTVPGTAPAGNYWYCGYVGDYTGIKWDSSGFTFTKSATGIQRSGFGDWTNTGEEFSPAVGARRASPLQPASGSGATPTTEVIPNPFNPSTVASFELRVPGYVSLRVYDTAGRLVTMLVDGWRDAGTHEVTFDGSGLAAGVYLYHLQTGEQTASGKMVLVK